MDHYSPDPGSQTTFYGGHNWSDCLSKGLSALADRPLLSYFNSVVSLIKIFIIKLLRWDGCFTLALTPLCILFHIAIKQLCDSKRNITSSTSLVYSEK